MLDYVQTNRARVGTILVYSIDRFSRSEESIGIATRLKKQGVKLLSVMQPMDTDTASGAFQQKMYLLFSELENQQRKDKCIAGMREKLRQG